jgi:hypothetical protein
MKQNLLVSRISLDKNWSLNILHSRIATITYQGVRKTTYFAFNTKKEAELFKDSILTIGACSAVVIRHSERLTRYQYECKCWHCDTDLILHLLERLNQS